MTHSHETQTPEQNYTTEEITGALANAQEVVARLQLDSSFHAACAEATIHPLRDRQTPEYWHAFRMYVGGRVDAAKEAGKDTLQMDAIELLAAAPSYLLEQQKLTKGSFEDIQERRYAKEIVSWYNGMIRGFAQNYPETSASSLTTKLLTTVSETVHTPNDRNAAGQCLKNTIRGAQHELAFGQVLGHTGIPCRSTTVEEDLKGLDYVVGEGKHAIGVDVKASLSEVESRGSERLFAVKPNGNVVMYSMVLDAELHDRFFVDDQLAKEKSTQLIPQLIAAQKAA